MAKFTNNSIDIDTMTWAEVMALSAGGGTLADFFEETKIDRGTAVTAANAKHRVGATFGNNLGVILEETWTKARAGASVPDATTEVKGIVELATDGERAASKVLQSNDSRVEIVGTSNYISTGTNYGVFAELGEVPEGEAWWVTGEVWMAADNGSALFSGGLQFRLACRRRAGASLSVTTMTTTGGGTGSPAAQHNSTDASSNQVSLESRLSSVGNPTTVYQAFRYRIARIVMP